MTNKKLRIKAIELEHFQSIIDPIRIDFSPITLFYGPNSAGKSSVYDAIELLSLVWDPRTASKKVLSETLTKWAHIPKDKKNGTRKIRIAIEIEAIPLDWTYPSEESPVSNSNNYSNKRFDTYFDYPWTLEYLQDKQFRYEFSAHKDFHEDFGGDDWTIDTIEISKLKSDDSEEQEMILSVSDNLPNQLKNSDYEIYAKSIKVFHRTFNSLPEFRKVKSENIIIDNKKIEKLVNVEDSYIHHMGTFLESSIYNFEFDYYDLSREWESLPNGTLFDEAYYYTTSYFGRMLCEVLKEFASVVKADRTIPNPDDTIVMCKGITLKGNIPYSFGLDPQKNEFGNMVYQHYSNKDYFYSQLANQARYHKIYWDVKNQGDTNIPDDGDGSIDPNSNEMVQFNRINRYLSENLFHEKGYQIDSEVRFILPLDFALDDTNPKDNVRCPSLVRLRLIDGDGRYIEIQDVGSGIAFVLPVLISLSSKSISAIQQPELHLHPALQASLGDVFVDRLNEDVDKYWQAIVETHSEHLLLRMLKKIREGFKENDESPRIKPKDIAIYYFNPLPQTGSTEVRKMLITPNGDFFNTWPRGFFNDRDKDLFE
jgi:AAA15 family ATPase/GTPase